MPKAVSEMVEAVTREKRDVEDSAEEEEEDVEAEDGDKVGNIP